MKTKLTTATLTLWLTFSASAQITRYQKYDWGWSYRLEMPETGLKCEFPEKPKVTTLAYGYLAAAAYEDELYMAVKLENPDPYDIICKTDEFVAEMRSIHGLPISEVGWGNMTSVNGNLMVSGDAPNGYARFHIDAIATEEVLTIFIYSTHDELSIPGYFFASSYSVNDAECGTVQYAPQHCAQQRPKILEYNNGKSLVKLENCPVTVQWPAIPRLTRSAHESVYQLTHSHTTQTVRVLEVGPQMSYAFFNTLVSRDQHDRSDPEYQLISDQMDVAVQMGEKNESYFRKLTYQSANGLMVRYYVGSGNRVLIQELCTQQMDGTAEAFLTSFDRSVRNEYDLRTYVSK